MKKLIIVPVFLLVAAPALAADWQFYGSIRMGTFWNHSNFGNLPAGTDYPHDGTVPNGINNDSGLIWQMQDDSVIGFKVKADKVKGQIELGLNNATDGGDPPATTRLAWGAWEFKEGAELLVGKDDSPLSQSISGQVFNNNSGLKGIGVNDGLRPGQIRLDFDGFKIAAVSPYTSQVAGDGDPDPILPKLEATYTVASLGCGASSGASSKPRPTPGTACPWPRTCLISALRLKLRRSPG